MRPRAAPGVAGRTTAGASLAAMSRSGYAISGCMPKVFRVAAVISLPISMKDGDGGVSASVHRRPASGCGPPPCFYAPSAHSGPRSAATFANWAPRSFGTSTHAASRGRSAAGQMVPSIPLVEEPPRWMVVDAVGPIRNRGGQVGERRTRGTGPATGVGSADTTVTCPSSPSGPATSALSPPPA